MASPKGTGGLDLQVLGHTGLQAFGGFVIDDPTVELQGQKGRKAFREMSDNDSVVAAILFALEMLIRQVDWSIDPGGTDEGAAAAAQLVEECLYDMAQPWQDTISEILTFLIYGFSLHEIIYKRRSGKDSAYTDGRIGWHSWPMRGQETIYRWEFGDQGQIAGAIQISPPNYQEVELPIEKCLLFRTTTRRGSPEGRSVLRGAYLSYWYKKHLQAIEGIGAERDLAGLPKAMIPSKYLAPTATDSEAATAQAFKEIVTQIRRDGQEGLVIPSDRDEHGNLLFDVQLMGTGGTRQFDTDTIITRYDTRIMQTVMADFLTLGHQAVGSKALAETKGKYFTLALEAWLQSITAIVNTQAIPRLLKLNGIQTPTPPQLIHGDIERGDLGTLGAFVLALAQAGFQLDTAPDGPLIRKLLEEGDLPAPPDPEGEPAQATEPGQFTEDEPANLIAAIMGGGTR